VVVVIIIIIIIIIIIALSGMLLRLILARSFIVLVELSPRNDPLIIRLEFI